MRCRQRRRRPQAGPKARTRRCINRAKRTTQPGRTTLPEGARVAQTWALLLVEVVSDRVGAPVNPYDNTGAAGVKVVGQRGPWVDMGTGKLRPLELGVAEACPLELGAVKVRPLELGVLQVRLSELGAFKIRSLELGVFKLRS